MIDQGRLRLWSVAAVILYTLAYYLDWAPFLYYYDTGEIGWFDSAGNQRPSISWYGWLSTATAGASLISVIVPARVARLLPAEAIVLLAFASALAIFLYESRWFF